MIHPGEMFHVHLEREFESLNLSFSFFSFYHFALQLGTTSQPYYIHWCFELILPHRPRCVGRNVQGTYPGQDYLWVVLGAPQTLPSRVSVGTETEVLCCVLMTARHASATTIRELWKKLFITHKSWRVHGTCKGHTARS